MSTSRFACAVILDTALLFAMGSGFLLAGCKSPHAVSVQTPTPGQLSSVAPTMHVPPPPDSRLAAVKRDMTQEQVQEILGSPTGRISYPTAGTYNPYGSDSGNRVVYKYASEGRVLFSVPKYGGSMRVLRVDYDPSEDGQ